MEKQKEDKVLVDKNSFERLQKGNTVCVLCIRISYPRVCVLEFPFACSIGDGCR